MRSAIGLGSTLIITCILAASTVFAQGGDVGGDRVRGRITGITGNTIDYVRRDGTTGSVVTTGNTRFRHNGEEATLDDFQVGDRMCARGSQNGNGAFVADLVRGKTPSQSGKADDTALDQVILSMGAIATDGEPNALVANPE
jgi:hypothetical protein